MSRIALVAARRRASCDKTRVSSIDKRRVTPVPEEGAASTEETSLFGARTSGLERSWMALLEVSTRRSQFGLRDLACVLLAERPGRPLCTAGGVSSGCRRCAWIAIQSRRRRGLAGPPTTEAPRGADPGDPPPSGSVPAPSLPSWRSAGSSPAGTARVRPSHPLDPGSPRPLTSCLYFSWHAARRCYPRRPCQPLPRALARLRGDLEDPREGSGRPRRTLSSGR